MNLIATILCVISLSILASSEYQFKGSHFLASYSECDHNALVNLPDLEQVLFVAAKKSGATVLNSAKHIFEGDGLTMVLLLSESHASIHTYPECDSCFVDLFTCGEKCSSEDFDEVLRLYLRPKTVNGIKLIRDKQVNYLIKKIN